MAQVQPAAGDKPSEPVIIHMVLGPLQSNCYLVGDASSQTAVVIDPAWHGDVIAYKAQEQGWRITQVWLTHAHFDHFAGAAGLVKAIDYPIPVALHPEDMPIWRGQGGAPFFRLRVFDPGPEPSIALEHGMQLAIGEHAFEVRHTPGHSPGHVVFLAREPGLVFCGDLVFQGSVGRSDLFGGDWDTLLESIRNEILVLPDETRLLPGHGAETTVGHERQFNMFLSSELP